MDSLFRGREDLCLFLDVDGTLIDIAERPESVDVPRSLTAALAAASELCGGALALISGRTIANLDSLFDPLKLRASGVHGAEIRFDPDGGIAVEAGDILPADVIDAVRKAVADIPGTMVENKQFSAAVHYRLAPEWGDAIGAALAAILAAKGDQTLSILPGHMVFEIKRATFDKGMAISRFMMRSPFAPRIPVFLGDDVTDRPGFDAVLARGGYAYSVGRVFPGLSGSFPDPAAVRRWLAGLTELEAHRA